MGAEEDQRLQALAWSGASVADMAKQMKRSEEAIRSRAYRLKILVAKSRKLRDRRRRVNEANAGPQGSIMDRRRR